MRISDAGIDFIASWEGLRTRPYDDGGPGVGNCTIGIGHLIHLDPCDGRPSEAAYRNGITTDMAYALFRFDVQRFVDAVNAATRVPLTQNQFDAMVDFAYNCGAGAYANVVAPVVNARGDVCRAIMPYVNPAWARDALTRRRKAECAMFYGPATPIATGGDEMWHRHNEVANNAYWTNTRHTFGAGERATLQLNTDLPRVMALTPAAIDLDFYTEGPIGALFEVRDGNGNFAGTCDAKRRNAVIRTVPVNGTIRAALGGPVTVTMGVVAYVD